MQQKLEFAQRLRQAMQAAGMPPRPSVLVEAFNRRYWGRSVTFQAVSRWLRGEAIPAQDKLVVLAELLRVPPDELRFGKLGLRIQDEAARRDKALNYLERETFDLFLQLPTAQKNWCARSFRPAPPRPSWRRCAQARRPRAGRRPRPGAARSRAGLATAARPGQRQSGRSP